MTTRTRSQSTPWSAINEMTNYSMTDVVVPDYKARVASGELLCNPMTNIRYHAQKIVPGTIAYSWYNRTKTNGIYSPWTYNGVRSMSLGPQSCRQFTYDSYGVNLYNTCVSWLNSRLGGFVTTGTLSERDLSVEHTALSAKLAAGMTQSLVTLAETPKTIKMVATALEVLRHPFRVAKEKLRLSRNAIRNDPGARAKVIDLASNLWMEARFGWRPLVYDIVGHLEAVEKEFSVRQTVRSTRPVNSKDALSNVEVKIGPLFGSGRVYATGQWSYSGRVFYRLGQTGDMAIDYGNFQHFGALDPLGTAWELVTLSWAVDYFLNVGDMLQSLQAYFLLDERVGWTTRIVSGTATYTENVALAEYTFEFEKGNLSSFIPTVIHENFEARARVPRTDFSPVLGSRISLGLPKVLDLAAVVRNLYKR